MRESILLGRRNEEEGEGGGEGGGEEGGDGERDGRSRRKGMEEILLEGVSSHDPLTHQGLAKGTKPASSLPQSHTLTRWGWLSGISMSQAKLTGPLMKPSL